MEGLDLLRHAEGEYLEVVEKDFGTGVGETPKGTFSTSVGFGILVDDSPVGGFLGVGGPSLGRDDGSCIALWFGPEAKVRPGSGLPDEGHSDQGFLAAKKLQVAGGGIEPEAVSAHAAEAGGEGGHATALAGGEHAATQLGRLALHARPEKKAEITHGGSGKGKGLVAVHFHHGESSVENEEVGGFLAHDCTRPIIFENDLPYRLYRRRDGRVGLCRKWVRVHGGVCLLALLCNSSGHAPANQQTR